MYVFIYEMSFLLFPEDCEGWSKVGYSTNRLDLWWKLNSGVLTALWRDMTWLSDVFASLESGEHWCFGVISVWRMCSHCFCVLQISSTLSWSLYELSRHPEVQTALRDEVRRVMKGRSVPEARDVAAMPLMKAVIKEILRYESSLVSSDTVHPVHYIK